MTQSKIDSEHRSGDLFFSRSLIIAGETGIILGMLPGLQCLLIPSVLALGGGTLWYFSSTPRVHFDSEPLGMGGDTDDGPGT